MTATEVDEQVRQKATEWFVRIRSAQLSSQEESRFYDWLAESSAHQSAYIEAEALWNRLAVVENVTSSDFAATAAAARDANTGQINPDKANTDKTNIDGVDSAIPPRRWFDLSGWQWGIGGALASLLLVMTFIVLQPGNTLDTYQTGIGEQRQLALGDGSSVHLNTNSHIQIDKQDSRRLVMMDRGEAFFDVTPDSQRPFIVKTRAGSVTVLGTQFSVRVSRDDMLVTVVEGKVAVSSNTQTDKQAESIESALPGTLLIADQQHSISAIRNGELPLNVNALAQTRWREGKLVYNNVSFAAMVADLSRYFEGELTLGEPGLASKKVVAVFDLQDKAHTVATLEAAFNLRAEQRPGKQTVLYSAL